MVRRIFTNVPLTYDEIEQLILSLQNWQREYENDDSFEPLINKLRGYLKR